MLDANVFVPHFAGRFASTFTKCLWTSKPYYIAHSRIFAIYLLKESSFTNGCNQYVTPCILFYWSTLHGFQFSIYRIYGVAHTDSFGDSYFIYIEGNGEHQTKKLQIKWVMKRTKTNMCFMWEKIAWCKLQMIFRDICPKDREREREKKKKPNLNLAIFFNRSSFGLLSWAECRTPKCQQSSCKNCKKTSIDDKIINKDWKIIYNH